MKFYTDFYESQKVYGVQFLNFHETKIVLEWNIII